jgi:hypothetical protein
MGTPHHGTEISLGKVILGIASIVTKTNRSLVGNLERDGEWLEAQLRSYLSISDDFKTVYCYETKPTPPSNELVGLSSASVCIRVDMPKLVPYASAVVRGARDAPAIGIQKDHQQIVKFPSNRTKAYVDVALHVKRMVPEASRKVEVNWAEWDKLKGECAIQSKSLFVFDLPL